MSEIKEYYRLHHKLFGAPVIGLVLISLGILIGVYGGGIIPYEKCTDTSGLGSLIDSPLLPGNCETIYYPLNYLAILCGTLLFLVGVWLIYNWYKGKIKVSYDIFPDNKPIYCHKCGVKLKKGANFCHSCKAKL